MLLDVVNKHPTSISEDMFFSASTGRRERPLKRVDSPLISFAPLLVDERMIGDAID